MLAPWCWLSWVVCAVLGVWWSVLVVVVLCSVCCAWCVGGAGRGVVVVVVIVGVVVNGVSRIMYIHSENLDGENH